MDGDGKGEYGTLSEMTGSVPVRGFVAAADGDDGEAALLDPPEGPYGTGREGEPPADGRLNPPLLSPSLANVDERGIVTKAGYCFRIFLPGAAGAVRETGSKATAPLTGPADPDAAELSWCAYAWPVQHGNSGTRVFFVNAAGDVLQAPNDVRKYSGHDRGPAFDAAWLPGPAGGWTGAPATGTTGRDGELWTVTN